MYKQANRCVSFALAAAISLVFCLGNLVFTSKTVLASETGSPGSSGGISSIGQNRKIDVWDFGGVAQEGELYANNITAADINSWTAVGSKGLFSVTGESSFGDLTINYLANDRLYAPLSAKNYGTNGFATSKYSDGYNANGMYYCNGTGGITRRFFIINNVKAGDKIVAYMASSNASTDDLCFLYMGSDASQLDKSSFTNIACKYEFVAKYDGSYKLYTTAVGAKPIYNRIMRIPGVKVSGSVDLNGNAISGYSISFNNETTGTETQAQMNENSFEATLAPDYTYVAVLKGATGYGFTNDTKIITPSLADVAVGLSGVALKVEKKATYSYTGKICGFSSSYDISKLSINLEADKETLASDVPLVINSDLTFSAVLEPDVAYTLKMSGVNDYEIVSDKTVNNNKDTASDINVALKPKYSVSGGYLGLPSGKTVTAISFKNLADDYIYQGTVNAAGYSVQLRDGSYSVDATVDGYKTNTHIVVKGGSVSKDLLFVSTDTTIVPIPRVSDIYVGYPNKQNNYATVNEAIKACKAMNPTSEAERITIHIAPGTYREQIIISTPYITLVNDEKEDVLLTWYYGIGYKYYSSDATGYYNPENAYDKFEKKIVQRWGASTRVLDSATGFRAENIIFEASFNRYITDEELEDGVEVSGESITFNRKYGADVSSKAATERSAAMAIEADDSEFYNCSFLGSQDTLYIGGTSYNRYFKNCFIEGNTDFIFGDGDAVFDGCNLSWKGYSDTDKQYPGFLTAARDAVNGFLFRNCIVTGNSQLNVGGGDFGRPWGKDAKVKFINTKLENGNMISDAGWSEMSGNKPSDAKFGEYNTVIVNGTAEDTSKRAVALMSQSDAANINVLNYFGAWRPAYYTAEDSVAAFATDPYVTDNGDINAPYPGHTLTVHYSLGSANDKNDASVIRWYRVAADNSETLVKSTTAAVSRTYKITKNDENCHIKVVVIPETFSGKTAAQKAFTVEAAVREGYEEPSSNPEEFKINTKVFAAIDNAAVLSYLDSKKIDKSKAILAEISATGDASKFIENTKVKVAVGTKFSGIKYDVSYFDAATGSVSALNSKVVVDSEGNAEITVPKLGKYLLTEVKSSGNDNPPDEQKGNQSDSSESQSDGFVNRHSDAIDKIGKASSQSDKLIEIKLNDGENIIPIDLFDEIAGKDVQVTLTFGDYAWTLLGTQISAPPASRVFYDLEVKPIYDNTISKATGGSEVA
ncbi:MAG TPA: hypothetical protein DCP97_04235, partial [Ruminococcaceae bacterium]|nr:hypothetical protein [Oscillospiraceae bacterium]